MKSLGRYFRDGATLVVASLLLQLSVIVPLLESADVPLTVALESEHGPGDCPASHDHTVCTQAGANRAAPAARPMVSPLTTHGRAAAHPRSEAAQPGASSPVAPARAPPSA